MRSRPAAPHDEVVERELPRARVAAQADRPERDPGRRRRRQRRVHPVPVHRLQGRARVPLGRRRRRRGPVLHQHGDRALHARDRADGDHRLPAAVEAVGPDPRAAGAARHVVARLGHERGDGHDVPVRRRRRERDRDRGAARRSGSRSPRRRSSTRRSSGSSSSRSARCCCSSSIALVAAVSSTAYSDTSQDDHELRHVPERDRAGDPRRRAGGGRRRRRQQPRAEQLDPRQGLRHGPLRAAHRLADHRRGGGGAVGPVLPLPARRAEHGPLAHVVAPGQPRAVPLLRGDRRRRRSASSR